MMKMHRWHAVSGAALVLALTPVAGHAADLVQTLKDQGQFSELVNALDQAGITQTLEGEGPFTVFAPTDEAFGKLPQGAIDQLSQGDGELDQILKHHVVEGQEVMAKDVLGQETQVSTLSGDQLTVDGTGAMVVLVPTGLRVMQVGNEIFVERDVAAMATPAVTVTATDQQQQPSSGSASDQPQQQAATSGGSSQESTAGSGSGQEQMADTRNPEAAAGEQLTQEERSPAAQGQQGGGAGQQTATSGGSSQQAATSGGSGQQSTSGSGSSQEQMAETQNPEAAAGEQFTQEERSPAAQQGQQGGGAGERQPMAQQQGMLRAAMVVEPDIQADNGVIHAINEVLIPQKVEQQLEQAKGRQGSSQGQQGSSN